MPHWSELLVPAGLMAVVFVLSVYPLTDTDFWWHLRTGQLIWERGDVPRTDWYLFTDSERPWIDLHYGFQLLIAGMHALGGINLIIVFKALVIAAAVGVGSGAAGQGLPAWLRGVLWIPPALCMVCRGGERPEILSLLFLACWLWIAFRAERQPGWMWSLPIIQVVWVNFHALYILGLIVGCCFGIDLALRRWAGGRYGLERVAADFPGQRMLLVGSLCALAALVNPYVLDGALLPLELYRKFSAEQEFYASRIFEFEGPWSIFRQLGFSHLYLTAELVTGVLAGISLLCGLIVTRRWSPLRWLLLAAFGHLGWEAIRNINMFGLVAGTVLVAEIAELNRHWARGVAAKPKETKAGKSPVLRDTSPQSGPFRSFSAARVVGNLGMSALFFGRAALTVCGITGSLSADRGAFGLGEKPWWFGHEAMQFAGQPGFPDRAIVSHIGLAATYEFHNGPDRKVFLDPRLEVSTQKTFRAQKHLLNLIRAGDRRWEASVQDASGNLPVVILDSRLSRTTIAALLNTPGWRLVYADPSAGVFLSTKQADALNLPGVEPTPLLSPPP
jgi:hypothetical protein